MPFIFQQQQNIKLGFRNLSSSATIGGVHLLPTLLTRKEDTREARINTRTTINKQIKTEINYNVPKDDITVSTRPPPRATFVESVTCPVNTRTRAWKFIFVHLIYKENLYIPDAFEYRVENERTQWIKK
ncbi:uncharacterized protein LOC129718615 [Wyeomyia smithii]|uniref:uncharacterized protein LOC129718615 n=1 Tax=Wyeomyia smithii TaxID=174621 RepID=UPI002467FDF1|nr:uncharacterized protein LOC129718615 [Wyeomyia smithii]